MHVNRQSARREKVHAMDSPHHPTVWLQPAEPAHAGCGHCETGTAGAACQSHLGGQPCMAPQLRGAESSLRRVIESLRSVLDPGAGANIVDLHLVKALRIEDGEAELDLTFPANCSSARQVAEDAFQALRRLLPDTDIYVRHPAH